MATTNYGWTLPTVGGSADTWGDELNTLWTDLDILLGGVSATEFAILDGATVATAELNTLDGITATTAELNKLDGVTVSTTEINHLSGVTHSIQGQLHGKITSVIAGTDLSGGGFSGSITINHANTSNQGSVNNGGNTVIQDISLDSNGHVTNINSKTVGGGQPTTHDDATAIGAMAYCGIASSGVLPLSYGDTVAGSELRTASAGRFSESRNGLYRSQDPSFTGTWKCLGYIEDANRGATLFVRTA